MRFGFHYFTPVQHYGLVAMLFPIQIVTDHDQRPGTVLMRQKINQATRLLRTEMIQWILQDEEFGMLGNCPCQNELLRYGIRYLLTFRMEYS